jgi:hypothetical protein
MTNPHEKPVRARPKYILLTPLSAKVLSVVAIGAVYLWFLLKFFLSGDQPALQLAVGVLGLVGFCGSIVLFLCTYGFLANSPDEFLDEREIQNRNAAYVKAYIYATVMLLVGSMASGDIVGWVFSGFEVTLHVVTNFLTLALFTCLIMPATVLAWQDKGLDE